MRAWSIGWSQPVSLTQRNICSSCSDIPVSPRRHSGNETRRWPPPSKIWDGQLVTAGEEQFEAALKLSREKGGMERIFMLWDCGLGKGLWIRQFQYAWSGSPMFAVGKYITVHLREMHVKVGQIKPTHNSVYSKAVDRTCMCIYTKCQILQVKWLIPAYRLLLGFLYSFWRCARH